MIFILLIGCLAVITLFWLYKVSVTDASGKVLPSNYNAEVVKAGGLSGLYLNAGENKPIVLIIPGSGPTDLNGNNPLGVNANTYKLLAEALFENGVSSVRADKRGMFSSSQAGDPNDVTVDIYASDYSDWVATIIEKEGVSCIYLLGHSEGALMASAAANINDRVCGLILVAGAGRTSGEILREQLKSNPANIMLMGDALRAIKALENGEHVDVEGMNPALKRLFSPLVQDYLISLMQVKPDEIAKKANKRTLIFQGDNDLQISVVDAQILSEATQGKLVILKGVNHVLKKSSRIKWLNMRTYKKPKLPVSEQLVDEIIEFVLKGSDDWPQDGAK